MAAMAAKLGLITFSKSPNVACPPTSPAMDAGLPTDFKEEDLRLIFKEDTFYLFWDSEFARIRCHTNFNDEIAATYSDPTCKNWEREFRQAREFHSYLGKDPERVEATLGDIHKLFNEYRLTLRNIQLSLRTYLKALEDSKTPRANLSEKDFKRYHTILRMLPCLDRRFRDLETIANGILLGGLGSLEHTCCTAIRKASACMYSLTREDRFDRISAGPSRR